MAAYDDGIMAGLEDVEMVVQTAPMPEDVEGHRTAAAARVLEHMSNDGVLVSAAMSGPLKSEYDHDWFVLVHVWHPRPRIGSALAGR